MSISVKNLTLNSEVLQSTDKISANMTDFISEKSVIYSINKYDKSSSLMCKPEHSWWTVSQGKIKVSQLQDQYSYRAFEVPLEPGKTYNIWFNDSMDKYYKIYNCYATDDDYNIIKDYKPDVNKNLFLMSKDTYESDYTSKGYELFHIFDIPEGATRICFSCTNGNIYDVLCIKEGTWRFPYVEYNEVVNKSYTYDSLENVVKYSDTGLIKAEMTDFVNVERVIISNIYNNETMHSEPHHWWEWSKNKLIKKQLDDKYNYWALDIPVKPNQDYRIWYNVNSNYWCQAYNVIAVDEEYHEVETFVKQKWTVIEHSGSISDQDVESHGLNIIRTIHIPEHATRLLISVASEKLVTDLCLNEGTEKVIPYKPYNDIPETRDTYTYSGLEDVIHGSTLMKFQLPESINILSGRWAGDTGRAGSYVELFYNDSVAGNPLNTNIYKTHVKDGVYCYSYERFCRLLGHTTGHNTLTLDMYDDTLNKIDSKDIDINVIDINNIHSPDETKNILMVGDSLTQGGEWCKEFMRMLTSNTGSPIGLNLSNFNSLGSKFNGNVNFEGVGGWEYSHYNTNYKDSSVARWFNCTHTMTKADIMSVYKESTTNEEWRIVDIKDGSVKLYKNSSAKTSIPSSGELLYVSGGVTKTNISYTSTSDAVANPFWNEDLGRVDFKKYTEDRGATSLDYCYVLLGWNSKGYDNDTLTSKILTFSNNIHSDYPNCQIMLIGLQRPSHDGCGSVRTAWNSDDYLISLKHSIKLNDLYKKIASEHEGINYVNFASFFDSKYNYPTTKSNVNLRSSKTEDRQSNNVHPNTDGQMQLADVVLRDFIGRI